MTYGLKGWYWTMPNGRLGVVYVAKAKGQEHELISYLDARLESPIRRALQVDDGLQKELREFHDSKGSLSPKPAPLTPRKFLRKIQRVPGLRTVALG